MITRARIIELHRQIRMSEANFCDSSGDIEQIEAMELLSLALKGLASKKLYELADENLFCDCVIPFLGILNDTHDELHATKCDKCVVFGDFKKESKLG